MERKQRFAGYGGWLLLAAASSIILLAALAFASTAFEVYPDKSSYYPNQDVYLVVSGPVDSGFVVQVLNPTGSVVSEKSGRTTSSGNSYLSYGGFSSEGVYDIRLIVDGSVKAVSSFIVAKPGSVITTTSQQAITTTTATTGSVTTITVTTSFISPTTPTTTVVTTGGGGTTSVPPNPATSTIPPSGIVSTTFSYLTTSTTIPPHVFASGNVRWIKRRPLGGRSPVSASSSAASSEYDAPLGMLTGSESGSPITETAVGQNFVLSAYDTDFELLDQHSSPVSKKITYRIFNKRSKFYSYVAIATSGELRSFKAWSLVNRTDQVYRKNVTYYPGDVRGQFSDAQVLEYVPPQSYENGSNSTYGNYTLVGYPYYEPVVSEVREFDEPTLLFETSDFMDGWRKGSFSYLQDDLKAAGVDSDIENVLDPAVLPEPDQIVYMYRVPHRPNSWEYFEYETDNTPSKFFALDPVGGSWWNETWKYRKGINITNNEASILIKGYSIKLTLNHSSLVSAGKSLASGNDIRVTWWNGTKEIELDRVNETGWNTASTQIWFKLQKNISGSGRDTVNYSLYYNNPIAGTPPTNRSKVYLWWDDFNRANKADITTEASYGTKFGAGTWSINGSRLKNFGGGGDPNKLFVTALGTVSNDIEMTVKMNVTTFATGDLSRMGLSMCMDGANGQGYCSLWHTDYTGPDLLNDARSWGTNGAFTWALNRWYYMKFRVINPAANSGQVKVWQTNATEPASWTVDGNFGAGAARTYGPVGFAGSDTAGDITFFDNIKIRYIKTTEPTAAAGVDERAPTRLRVNISRPLQNAQFTRLAVFLMNGTVNCTRGDCENVSARAQYLTTQTPTKTWTETTTSDFNSYTQATNITIYNGQFRLSEKNPAPAWWDTTWKYRKRLNITNRAAATLVAGFSLNYTLNHSSLVSAGKSLASGNDLRVVFWDNTTSTWVELDRVNETGWNTASTKIWFKAQKNISATRSDLRYYIYYGNSAAGTPPASKSNVYLWWDDFNRANKADITSEASYGTKFGPSLWSINGSRLKNVGAGGDPNKLFVTALGTVSSDIEMIVKMNVTTFATGDLSRMGLSMCMDNANGQGYCSLWHTDYTGPDLLNDARSWGTAGAYTWALNRWYYMKFRVINPAANSGLVKVWQTNATEPAAWTVNGNFGAGAVRTYGPVGFTGSDTAGDITFFDDIIIRYALSTDPAASSGAEQSLNLSKSGTYISSSFDTSSSSIDYGKIYWYSQSNANTTITVYTRTSANNASWGSWFTQTNNSDVYAADQRYIEYRVDLSTTNIKQTPIVGEMDTTYKISTLDWANMTTSTPLSAVNPFVCGILNQSRKTCKPAWNVTAKQAGKYSVRIYAGSPTKNTSGSRNITVKTATYVVDFTSNQSSVAKTKNVLLSARLWDDLSQPMSGYRLKFYDLRYNKSIRYSYSTYPSSPISGQTAYVSRDAGSIPPSTGPPVRNESAFNNTAYGAINKSDNIYATTTSVYNKTQRFVLSIPQDAAFAKSVFISWEGQRSSVGQVYLMAWNWSGSKWKTLTNRSLAAGTDALLNNTLSSRLSDFLNGSALVVLVEARSSGVSDSLRTDYVYANVSGNYLIGSGITNSSGQASVIYTIPTDTSLGSHNLMAYFAGSNVDYLLSSNATKTITIASITLIKNITAVPGTVGYGFNVTLQANVTDEVGVDKVFVNITKPNGISTLAQMTPVGGGIYRYKYSDTWVWGNYLYFIRANNTAGGVSTSPTQMFYVRADASLTVKTVNMTYGPNMDVNLVANQTPWWNTSYRYRMKLNITNLNKTLVMEKGYSVMLLLNTQSLILQGKMKANGDDLRIAWYNTTGSKWLELNRINESLFNAAGTQIWFPTAKNISGGGWDNNYYIYYGNSAAVNPPKNRSKVYLWWDDFSANSLAKYSQAKWVDIHGDAYTVPIYDAANQRVRFDTGDNVGSDMYPIGVTARDLLMEIDLYVTGSYPTNATVAIIGRLENPGGASTHYYFDYSAQSAYPSPGISIDTWTRGERNNLVYQATPYYYFRWNRVNNLKYAIFGGAHKVWINSNITSLPDISVRNITHNNAGRFGVDPAQAIGWWDNYKVRRFVGTDPSVSQASEEDRLLSRLYNRGSLNLSGYLEMRVQRYSGGTWVSFEAPFVSDRTPPQKIRTINAGNVLMLDSIWNPAGWNTSLNPGGLYRAYVRLTDPSGNTLTNDDGSLIVGWYNFTIVSSYMQLTRIKHENNVTAGLNEYETKDNIAWVNVTAINRNASAVNASITLNVLNSVKGKIGWGPLTETKYCGNLAVNASCEKKFDNSTAGYPIPSNATAGGYRFYWNVTMASKAGATKVNNSLYFRLHNVPDNTSSTLAPVKIFQNKSAIYNFTLTNPWSKNLTAIRVKVNCPTVAGLTCRCLGTALTYCNISSLAAGAKRTFRFNISTSSTPVGDYTINATLNYTNPGLEKHSWPQLRSKVLMVRIPGQFVVISAYPSNMTRGGYGILKGYSNNTLGSAMHNVYLNWTLPSGWTNSSGRRSVFLALQNPGQVLWNNITAYDSLSSALGLQTVELRSTSSEGYEDWDTRTITVYAKTYIKSLHPNNTEPGRGDVVLLTGQLTLDNSSILQGKTISLYDKKDNVSLGSANTDNLGWFYLYYTIPGNATLGNHTINATFPGQLASYFLKSWNKTWVKVHDKPKIISVSDSPDPQGYGYNVTIRANVTDLEGVSRVRACITPPSSSLTCYTMANYSANLYRYNYSNTWTWGDYSYYVWANDTAGKISTSATYTFHIGANAVLSVKTLQDVYVPNSAVNLTSSSSWWNYSWDYRRRINVTEKNNTQLTNYVVNITLDTRSLISAGKMQADCDDLRVVQGTKLLRYGIQDTTCNSSSTVVQFEINMSAGSSATNVSFYYGNPLAGNAESPLIGYRSDANTVMLYHFTEGAGTKTYDYSGSGNNGTFMLGPSWSSSPVRFGKYGVRLPGNNEYVQEGTSMSTLAAGTLETWFMLDDKFNSSTLYSQGIFGIWGSAASQLEVSLCGRDRTDVNCPFGGLMFKTETAGTGVDFCASNKISWNANQWYHVAVTWNGATRNIYINGVLNRTCADNGRSNFAGSNLFIGAAQIDEITDDPVKYFKGVVDEVRGSNIVRASTALLSRAREPTISLLGSEQNYLNQSLIYNDFGVGLRGYLLLKVQRYSGGTWVDVTSNNPVVNDTSPRAVSRYSSLNLKSIWNGPGEGDGWNTAKEPVGRYRAYAALRNPSGTILRNDDGSLIYSTYNFNITNPPYIIQLRQIRLYDVTNTVSKKTDKTYLIGSGLNSTFSLYTNKTYRAEVVVWNNASSTAAWTVSATDVIFHSGLNSSWKVNASGNIWYANSTKNMTGGTWSAGKVAWNTSKGGRLGINQNMTFYYIFNITSTSSKDYPVHFMLNDTAFTREDSSTYRVVLLENQPPHLFNLIYNVTKNLVHRGDSLVVYARWNEAISQAKAEYNSTSVTLQNYTITLPVPNPGYWTNQTMATTSFWRLGVHKVKIYAADLSSNWNTTLWYLPFQVWGRSSVLSSSLSSYTITNGSSVTMRCRVTSDNGSAINNYNVSFYNSTGRLGVNKTNSTGWAVFTFRDYSLGYENIKCNITNYTAIYHHITVNNYRTEVLRTIETKAPWYVSALQNTSKVHRGERFSMSAYWYDNYRLNYAWLESNHTGTFQNNSLASRQLLNVSQMRVYFNVTMPATSRLGRMGWRIWANDTSSNINKTNPRNYTYIWGYAIINASSLSPNPIYVNTYTTMRCKVVDYNNGSAISAYNVSFYSNKTGYMGKNVTNSTGWARWRFNDTTLGLQKITCNISAYPAKYYDPHTPKNASQVVRAELSGSDTTAPGATIYALNDTIVTKGERLKIYAKWTENITAAVVRFNSTSQAIQSYTPSTMSGQWTNHTMVTNSSWIVGVHSVKLNASDVWGNWNNTLAYLKFTVYGRSKVAWYSPTTTQYRGTIPLRCRVYDKDNNVGIGSYSVNFYNASWDYLGMAATNSSGIATYSWNATSKSVGAKTFYCTITDSGYYVITNPADDDATGTFDLYGRLNVTIDLPANKTAFYKGKTVQLNSTTKDELKTVVTPDTARWYDGVAQIAATEDASWVIPVAHATGKTTIIINVTKSYYTLISKKNVSIYVWGYSNVTWISPLGGNFSAGGTVSLNCRVRDVNSSFGVLNYPVRFYYKNSTETSYHYLGVRAANATGYAVYGWGTTGLPLGNYTTRCNITSNATLYYNVTAKRSGNTTIRLIQAAARLEVHLMLPPTLPGDGSATYSGGYQVGKNRTFVLKANVTCRNAACGNVQGTVRYNVTANPDTALGTVYATPFYVTGALPANPKSCSGNPLAVNASCVLNWTINATGALGSRWKLDVSFTGTSALSNQTNYTRIRITKVLILHLSTTNIDWGSRNPQTTCNPGVNNGSRVNISLDVNSNDADGIYLRGANMANGSYSIGIRNVTWAKVNLCTNGYRLNSTWSKMRNFTASGTSQSTYFWIDIPAVPALRYHGYTYVMANTTSSG